MNNIVKNHDIDKTIENLENSFNSLCNAKDLNDFDTKSLNYLSSFKSVIDNNENIKKNLSNNSYVQYVIKLRNYQQHHKSKYINTIESYSSIQYGGNHIGSKGKMMIGKSICDGETADNLHVESGRNINNTKANLKFTVTSVFNFSYVNQRGSTVNGYKLKDPKFKNQENFYQVLYDATNALISRLKESKI